MRGRILLVLFLACVIVAALAAPQTMPMNVSGPSWSTALFALALTGTYLTGAGGALQGIERLLNFFERRDHR
ncbi:hypothetical protein [Deinococcus sp. Leaf326]|uniref:hypothetical protein n=1 Tax=Deinococcus sp. Leaf326 TaxID=1736338 RepID=UPI0006F937F3|nr:hypothetical protein [Deinococcus sp. Leaf326]KQR40792.1 hypothetical protein ASF71_01085 [Deinococcus sp. Leaf326]